MSKLFIPSVMSRYDINADETAKTTRWFGVIVYDGDLSAMSISEQQSDGFVQSGIYRTDANFRNAATDLGNITHLLLDFKSRTVKVCTQEEINQLKQI